jgi:hypothetical protein
MASSSAVVTALVTTVTAAGITLALSEALRLFCASDVNDRVFFPRLSRRLAAGEEVVTPRPQRTLLSWVLPVLQVTDKALYDVGTGLDSILVLRFKRLCVWLVLLTLPFDMSVVLWANASGTEALSGDTGLQRLTMSHVSSASSLLWTHWVSCLLKVAVGARLLWRLGSWVALEEAAAATGTEVATLLVQLPSLPEHTSAAVVVATSGFPPPDVPVKVIPVFNPSRLEELAKKREAVASTLEDARWAREHPRPGNPRPPRPQHRERLCGFSGPKVDSIDAWTAELKQLDAQLDALRAAAAAGQPCEELPTRAAAFAIFSSSAAAAAARRRAPPAWTVEQAAAPSDVLWCNVGRLPARSRRLASLVMHAALYTLCLFFMVPIGLVSALSTLDNLEALLPFLKPILKQPVVRALLTGLLPGLALM